MLEQSRNDKIKTLGFLCYNLCVDGAMVFPQAQEITADIKENLNSLMSARKDKIPSEKIEELEERLSGSLVKLGCACYNLYVDNNLFNTKVIYLCEEIASINKEISGEAPKSDGKTERLQVSCPYGMETIPENFRPCSCGYRNRPEAKFCAKCGAELISIEE